jgi:hypothetical protein
MVLKGEFDMKYSIEGIEKSRIIKSTQIINKKDSDKAVIVNYLDGTQDVFDLNNENLKKIEEIAEEQGKMFVSKKGKILKRRELLFLICVMIFAGMLMISVGLKIYLGATIYTTIAWLASLLSGLMVVVSKLNMKSKEKYIKKYQLYFEQVKNKLSDYQQILEKEKQLTKQKNNDSVKLNSVLDLDNVSLKQVESINEKVERYYKVDRQKVKKLENPSLY